MYVYREVRVKSLVEDQRKPSCIDVNVVGLRKFKDLVILEQNRYDKTDHNDRH